MQAPFRQMPDTQSRLDEHTIPVSMLLGTSADGGLVGVLDGIGEGWVGKDIADGEVGDSVIATVGAGVVAAVGIVVGWGFSSLSCAETRLYPEQFIIEMQTNLLHFLSFSDVIASKHPLRRHFPHIVL